MTTDANPLVSVIIPTHKRADLLPRAVRSVLGQSYQQLELIVVDDASPDNTQAVLAQIEDPRLKVIRNQSNKGAAATRNIGLAAAKGDYIAFHDDDDIWLVDKLLEQLAQFQRAPKAGLCLCAYIEYGTNCTRYLGGEALEKQINFAKGNCDGGPRYNLIATPGWLVKREVLDAVGGFNEAIGSWDDWELALRMWRYTTFTYVRQPLYIKDHVQGLGLMGLTRKRVDDLELINQLHGDLWAGDKEVLARHSYFIGRIKSQFDPKPGGRKELAEAIRLQPFKLKYWAGYLLQFIDVRVANFMSLQFRRFIAPRKS